MKKAQGISIKTILATAIVLILFVILIMIMTRNFPGMEKPNYHYEEECLKYIEDITFEVKPFVIDERCVIHSWQKELHACMDRCTEINEWITGYVWCREDCIEDEILDFPGRAEEEIFTTERPFSRKTEEFMLRNGCYDYEIIEHVNKTCTKSHTVRIYEVN